MDNINFVLMKTSLTLLLLIIFDCASFAQVTERYEFKGFTKHGTEITFGLHVKYSKDSKIIPSLEITNLIDAIIQNNSNKYSAIQLYSSERQAFLESSEKSITAGLSDKGVLVERMQIRIDIPKEVKLLIDEVLADELFVLSFPVQVEKRKKELMGELETNDHTESQRATYQRELEELENSHWVQRLLYKNWSKTHPYYQ